MLGVQKLSKVTGKGLVIVGLKGSLYVMRSPFGLEVLVEDDTWKAVANKKNSRRPFFTEDVGIPASQCNVVDIDSTKHEYVSRFERGDTISFTASGLRKPVSFDVHGHAHGKRGRKPSKQARWARKAGDCNIRPLSKKLAVEAVKNHNYRYDLQVAIMRDLTTYVDN